MTPKVMTQKAIIDSLALLASAAQSLNMPLCGELIYSSKRHSYRVPSYPYGELNVPGEPSSSKDIVGHQASNITATQAT
jgi:hypothetical protein